MSIIDLVKNYEARPPTIKVDVHDLELEFYRLTQEEKNLCTLELLKSQVDLSEANLKRLKQKLKGWKPAEGVDFKYEPENVKKFWKVLPLQEAIKLSNLVLFGLGEPEGNGQKPESDSKKPSKSE